MVNGTNGSSGLVLEFDIKSMDFATAGEAATRIKRTMTQLGMPADIVRRVASATYEAEMNVVIHANKGRLVARIDSERIEICVEDEGPGIPDIDLAMQDGYSTAPTHVREMGFGAGMGLTNIKRCADEMHLDSVVGEGTTLRLLFSSKGRG